MNLYTLAQLQSEFRFSWIDATRILAENNVKPAKVLGRIRLYGGKVREVLSQERAERNARRVAPELQGERAVDGPASPNSRTPGWAPPVDLVQKLDRLQVTMDMVLEVLTRPQLEKADD